MKIQFFDNTIEDFISNLEMPTSAKVFRMLELLEHFGHMLGLPHSKHIGRELFELRIRGNQEVRLLYAFHKGMAVMLHGFFKKSQRIPRKELRIAHQKLSSLDAI